MVDEALQQLAQLKNEAEQNGFKFIKHLCKVGEIRVLSRSPENITLISEEIESLRAELLLDPNQESTSSKDVSDEEEDYVQPDVYVDSLMIQIINGDDIMIAQLTYEELRGIMAIMAAEQEKQHFFIKASAKNN